MSVVVGEFDQRIDDEEQQVFLIHSVVVHEKYHHASPMSYDIALIKLDQHIQLGNFTFENKYCLFRSQISFIAVLESHFNSLISCSYFDRCSSPPNMLAFA